MLLLVRISFLTLLISLISMPQGWGRSKPPMVEREGDDTGSAASRAKIDDLETAGRSASHSTLNAKGTSRQRRLLQKINMVTKAHAESDVMISYIKTVSAKDLKRASGIQNIVSTRDHFHLSGHGGLLIQSLLSHKDYSNAGAVSHSSNLPQPKGLFARLWLWWASWWTSQAETSATQ